MVTATALFLCLKSSMTQQDTSTKVAVRERDLLQSTSNRGTLTSSIFCSYVKIMARKKIELEISSTLCGFQTFS